MIEKGKQAAPGLQAPPGQQATPGQQSPPGKQSQPGLQGSSVQSMPIKQQASPELISRLKNKDSNVRQNAAEAIGIMRDETAMDSLIPMVKDPNRFVRQEVVRTLAKIGGPRSLALLTQALVEEKDEFVKDSIKRAMDKLQPS
jgi:hypothetical protein